MPLRSHYRLTAEAGVLANLPEKEKSNQGDIAIFITNFAQQQIKGK